MKRWPEIRAGLIALAIGFGLIDGCPLPTPDATPAWERGFVEPVRRIQTVAEWPVAWIRPWLRISQQWAVYQAPGLDRYRMSLEGQTADGAWHLLYRVADPEHREDEALIEYSRVRGSWDPTDRPKDQYRLFAAWLTGRALGAHAELVAARVRLERIRLRAGGFDPTGEYAYTYVHPRGVR